MKLEPIRSSIKNKFFMNRNNSKLIYFLILLMDNIEYMEFNLKKSIEVLERTPTVLEYMLRDISDDWALTNEGPDTFSPYDVIGHLIHGEKTDWVVRMEIIMSEGKDKSFEPYDRFAQYEESRGKTMNDLLTEFKSERHRTIRILLSKNLTEEDLNKKGNHPALGIVTLRQLLSTWVVHDLTHLAQISRVMAKQYKEEVGLWAEYISLLRK